MVLVFFVSLVFMSIVMGAAWAYQRHRRNGGWTDVFWLFGMGIVGAACALSLPMGEGGLTSRQLLVAGLTVVWSLRLGIHVLRRVVKSAEDARYGMFRELTGDRFQLAMFWFLQGQAWAAALLGLSIFLAAHNPATGLRAMDFLAASVLVLGIIGESMADHTLSRFKSDPRNDGLVYDRGLWGWTRHPNYFFESLVWLAYPMFAIDLSGNYPWGWLALSGPCFMYIILRYMTGVPVLEAAQVSTKGEAYRAYQARVSPFFPKPPSRDPQALSSARTRGQ